MTALAFIAGNAAMWLVPEWTELVARDASNTQTQQIFLTPFVRWVGLGVTTLYLGVLLRRFGKALLAYAALTPVVRIADESREII